MPGPPHFPHVRAAGHYRQLAARVAELATQRVVELGTAAGLSALALLHTLLTGSTLITLPYMVHTQQTAAHVRDRSPCAR
jgi:predicted O-methyltransferase YrrM